MVALTTPKRIGALAVPLAAATLLTACVPGTSHDTASDKAFAGPVVTGPAKMGKVQLKILDHFNADPGLSG